MIQEVVVKTAAEAETLVITTSACNVHKLQTLAGRRRNSPKAEKLFLRELTDLLNTK